MTLHVKLNRSYYPSQGTCQKFVAVTDKGVVATGVGQNTFEKSALIAAITNKSTYANEIYMMLSGNIQHIVDKSMSSTAEGLGFKLKKVGATI